MVTLAAIALVSCKSTDWSKVKYEVTPNPLQYKGDSVAVTIKVSVPEKVFQTKDMVTLTPAIKWQGGEKQLKSVSFQGEKVKNGTGTLIKKKEGLSYTYNDVVAYQPEMKVAELGGKATRTKKKKTKDFDLPKLADATITTPLLVMSDDQAISGKDQMPKVVPMNQEADIHFVISRFEVRSSETGAADMKGAMAFLKNASTEEKKDKKGTVTQEAKKNYEVKGVKIAAYASPDGETDFNANLAQDRADATQKWFAGEFKKMKNDAGQQDAFYQKSSTPEDWEGFKALMEQSTKVPDKEMILRILSTYNDNEKREQEIKNISKAYTEIRDEILPKLRRSKITIMAEKPARTDDVLKTMSTTQADSLTVEELLYAANLQSDMNTKMNIYNNVVRIYPNDWRGPNNLGWYYISQNKIDDAKAQFEKADKLNPNNPIIQNNLGVVARLKGDKKAAEAYFTAAGSAGPEVGHNMGIINILKGNYTAAVSNFGSENSFNAALAKLLAGNFDAALQTIDASKDKDSAMGYYLKAIIGARKGDVNLMNNSLKSAIAKDASIKKMAAEDREFIKFKDDSNFKSIVG
jgi:Flp pilus assembly protein TadD